MNLEDVLLQASSDIEESMAYFNDHEIIRGYRAMERAYKKLNEAIDQASIVEMKADLMDEILAVPNPTQMMPVLRKAERKIKEVLGE